MKQSLRHLVVCAVVWSVGQGIALAQEVNTVKQLPDFASIKDTQQKKKAFFDFMRPIVQDENAKVFADRKRMLSLREMVKKGELLSAEDTTWLASLSKKYRVEMKSPQDHAAWTVLTRRVDTIPMRLVLAQGANESSWGTSRFAKQGFNMFGMWCFTEGCGVVPKKRSKGATHEVAVFPSVNASVAGYIVNINRNDSYQDLRNIRHDLRLQGKQPTAEALSEGLLRYSERGVAYVKELQSMIRTNYNLMAGKSALKV